MGLFFFNFYYLHRDLIVFGDCSGAGLCINTAFRCVRMDDIYICRKIDDIVWNESSHVWNETFALLVCEPCCTSALVPVIMKWVSSKADEYSKIHSKVLDIKNKMNDGDTLSKLLFHYHHLACRYKIAYDCCKIMEYSI